MSTSQQEQKLMDYQPLILIMGMKADGRLESVLVSDKPGYEKEIANFVKWKEYSLKELVGMDCKILLDSIN
jgi:hypothetical protein